MQRLVGKDRHRSLQALPDGYQVKRVFDARSLWMNLLMFAVAVPVVYLVWELVWGLTTTARSQGFDSLSRETAGCWLTGLLTLMFTLVLHELIHGAGFWWFTGARPKFGVHLLAAYAGAPGWYIPCSQHVVIGLAPFVLITAAGAVLLLLVPVGLVFWIALAVLMNAGGAAGDLAVSLYELFQGPDVLAQDSGMKITLYHRAPE